MAPLKLTVLLCLGLFITICNAHNLELGDQTDGELVFSQTVTLPSIPEAKRTKVVHYKLEETSLDVIKAISVVDLDNGTAIPYLKSGGVGNTYVNIKLRSEKGHGLNYQVQIFV